MKHGSARIMLLALLLASCALEQDAAQDQSVTLSLTNAGSQPLRCRVLFGHWVDRDLGELPSGGVKSLAITQAAADGALYVLRSDVARKMMIETIQCAQPGSWMETYGQVDLAPIRSRRVRAIEASCAAPAEGGRTVCRLDRIG